MSQKQKILNYLQQGRSITPMDALLIFGCSRLAARIKELKKDGNHIVSEMIQTTGHDGSKARVAKYTMG